MGRGRGVVDRDLRARAEAMRRVGCSYREISAALGGISKSTLSGWLCDVPLSDEHRARLAQRSEEGVRSRAVAIRASRIRRTEVLQAEAASEIAALTDRELFLVGVALYWAEGSKAKPWSPSKEVVLINSDPTVIQVFLAWLRLVGVDDDRLQFRLSIHESGDLEAATTAWSAAIGFGPERFGKATLKRHNPVTVRRNTSAAYIGCLIIRVRRSVELNRRITGWWSGVAASASVPSGRHPGWCRGSTGAFGALSPGSIPGPGAAPPSPA